MPLSPAMFRWSFLSSLSLAAAWATGLGGVSVSPADLNDDGDVDDADFGIAFAAFTGPGNTTHVPEPGTLMPVSLMGLLIRRRPRVEINATSVNRS